MSNIIETPKQAEKPASFQETAVTPQSAAQALAMLTRYEQLQTEGPGLATPGNPNPEQAVNELGGVIAGFLFNNARALLTNFQIVQTEYVPLLKGLHGALLRGPFAEVIARSVVGGFAQLSAENKVNEQQPQNEQERKA